jgi:hypothetical protein
VVTLANRRRTLGKHLGRRGARPIFGLSSLLRIEDTDELLGENLGGIPYWTLIRNAFYRTALGEHFGETTALLGHARRPPVAVTAFLVRAIVNNFGGVAKSPVCILSNGSALRLVDGRWQNRLADPFALSAPTVVCEDPFGWDWREPRQVPAYSLAPLQARIMAERYVSARRYIGAARVFIAKAAAASERSAGWRPSPARADWLSRHLASRLAGARPATRLFSRLLSRVRPNLLLIQQACYSGQAPAVLAARRLGIRVAEYQHGAILSGHDAYNWGHAAREHPGIRQCLPDDILTYGEWWNGQFNAPVNKVTVGNPSRRLPGGSQDRLLVMGDGLDTDRTLAFTNEIAHGGHQVYFRPHPLERDALPPMPTGVVLDDIADINQSLADAGVVVAESSTTLFEAIGLSRRVLVWRTPKSAFNWPSHPFAEVASAHELKARMADPDFGKPLTTNVWADDWEANYRAYLSSVGL